MSSRAVFRRLCNPSLKEIEVKILFSPRETSGHDLRFRIVDRAADQMILAIPKRDHVAVRRTSKNLQHFAGKNPIVSVQNSRTWFDDNSTHAVMMSHLCQPLHNRFSIFPESKS